MQKLMLSTALAASLGLSAQAQTSDSPERVSNTPKLETLLVVASRHETPLREVGASVSVMDEADINALGFQSLADVLRTLPSVSITNSGGMGKASALRVRGEAGYRTQVRVDGVEISDPTGPQSMSHIHHLLNANVARVELLRGPQGMMYGADAGGVLNITTDRTQDGFSGGASAEGGRYESENYSGYVGGGNRHGDFYVSGAHAATDGFNAHTADETGETDGYENTTFHGRAGWNLGNQLRAEWITRDTEGESQFDQCGFPPIDDCVEDFNQRNHRGSVTHRIDKAENTLAYSQTEVERTNYTAGEMSYAVQGEIAKWELNGLAEMAAAHKLAYGIEHRRDQVSNLEREQRGAYVEYQGEYLERVYLTAGVRQDDNDDFGNNTSYRVSAAYLIPSFASGTLKFKSSLGTGFRAPSLYEMDFNQSQDTDLPPLEQEESRGVDLGVEYFGANDLHLEAVLFRQRIDNEIYFDMVGFTGYLQDDLRSESQGVELSAAVPLSPQWQIDANYTYTDAEASDGSPRARQPEHMANLGLRWQPIQPLTLSLNGRTNQNMVDAGVPLEDYHVLSGSARYELSRGLVLYVRGENITDEDYQEVLGYNTAGAAGYAGIELTF